MKERGDRGSYCHQPRENAVTEIGVAVFAHVAGFLFGLLVQVRLGLPGGVAAGTDRSSARDVWPYLPRRPGPIVGGNLGPAQGLALQVLPMLCDLGDR
jgi:hypothetical protein